MRLEQIQKKAGVSLVTVLLFMLVATIAATATYKWLTSESRSSASRLQKSEAYQSAMAGIENTRAWMTYSANDVGALIKQYKDNGKKIKLNSRLTPWLKAGQNYDVWLTGVNTGNAHNFKLKILSSGTASNGSKHNEVAIFNVDGLYKVKIPSESSTIGFDKAFQGKSDKFVGTDKLESGVVNGDFKGNQPQVEKSFLVTGSIEYEGAASMKGDLYVGKDLKNKGATTIGNVATRNSVVYVGGNLTYCDGGLMTVYGDMYVGGDVSDNCALNVSGNLTVGGKLKRNSAARRFTVSKNLVFKKTGSIDWTGGAGLGNGMANGEGVGVNTYLANISSPANSDGNRKANLGTRVYLYEGFPHKNCFNGSCPSGYCEGFFTSNCDANNKGNDNNRHFSFYNPINLYMPVTRVSTHRVSSWERTDDVLKNVGNNYWSNIDKMDAYGKQIDKTKDTVPVAILLKDEDVWTKMAYACALPRSGFSDNVIAKINGCYQSAKSANALYNGFLVLDLNFTEKVDPTKSLDGNFVFIMRGNSMLTLPSTTKNSVVMLYFPNGHNNDVMPGKADHCVGIGPMRQCDPYNYFIYSKGDIKQFLSWNSSPISGCVILASGSLKTSQGGTNLKYNKDVVNALATAGIIKENPEYTNLVSEGTSSTGATSSVAGLADTYFIANSPQLQVSLETQYENNEPLPTDKEEEVISSSFIILPRIIYLPRNPYGRLADYFNVVNLNGAAFLKDPTKVTGCASIPKTSLLYDRSLGSPEPLPVGLHDCNYTDNNKTVPFYVYVTSDELENKPYVQFKTDNQNMASTDVAYVELVYPNTTTGEEFKVKIGKTNEVDGTWSITTAEGVTPEGPCGPESSDCTFKLRFDNGSPKKIFKVETHDATAGTYGFQILDCVGCLVGAPNYESFTVSSSMTVERKSLLDYCEKVSCNSEYEKMKNTTEWPDCSLSEDASAWVKAVGVSANATNNCIVSETNRQWICGLSTDIKLMEVSSGVPEGCFAVIPPDDNMLQKSELTNGATKYLYASLKARKVTFHVGFKGAGLSTAKTIKVTSNRFTSEYEKTKVCEYSSSGCDYELFAGDNITLTVDGGKEDFSYWLCDPAESPNCHDAEPASGRTYTIDHVSAGNSIDAWFGQKDKHCFFDEFKQTSKDCPSSSSSNVYCFDYCENDEPSLCRIGGGFHDYSKWIVLGGSDDQQKIDYYGGENGYISLVETHTRGKKQSELEPVVAMSTVKAGLYGMLRTQFQPPRMGKESDVSSVRVSSSGFLLRSDDKGEVALKLNVFVDTENRLAAQVCITGACSEVRRFVSVPGDNPLRVDVTDIITLSATLSKIEGVDSLVLSAFKDDWNYSTVTTGYVLNNLSGFTSISSRPNEHVGVTLADPAFKIYDIGWKSDDYNATCWDVPPTVKCSFRAAYMGGIVPKNEATKPWVGLSSWFDDKGCVPQYLYNGDDASAGCNTSSGEAGYMECSATHYYTFTDDGLHGTVTGENVETRMAKAKVRTCSDAYLSSNDKALLHAEIASCGPFWVGSINNCNANLSLFNGSQQVSTHTGNTEVTEFSENELFAFDAANLRAASLKIWLDNPYESELEVYLRSSVESGYYRSDDKIVFSKAAHTTANDVAVINVAELADNSGFDPEKVNAVIIRNLGSSSVTITKIESSCDYVTSIQCKEVTYEGGKFYVHAVVKNAEGHVGSYSITATENDQNVSDLKKDFNCNNTNECPDGDEMGRITLATNAFNPYADAFPVDSKKYVFSVSMKDNSDAGNEVESTNCDALELEFFPINGECRWGNGENVVSAQQGTGLPSFQYRLPDCPTGTCNWEVVLLDGSSETSLVTGDGPSGGFANIPLETLSAHNTPADPLEVREYTIVFRSTSSSVTKFTSCPKTFNVTPSGGSSESTGALQCDFPAQVVSAQQNLHVSVTSSLPNQQYDFYIDNVKHSTSWIGSSGNTSNFIAPDDVKKHTYKITKMGEATAQCAGEFNTVNPMTCSISGNQFTLSVMSGVTCTNCNFSGVNCGYSCNGQNNITSRSYEFTPPASGSLTMTATCQCAGRDGVSCSSVYEATVETPTLTCPATTNKINVAPGGDITVSPITVGHCAAGCTYWVDAPSGGKVTAEPDATITTATSVTFTGETNRTKNAQNDYKLYVSNAKGSADCVVPVIYKPPTYTCPSNMEKRVGSSVEVRLTNVQYCEKGCSYKITGGKFTDNTDEGTGFMTGVLPKRIEGESAASTGDGTAYTLTLNNGYDDEKNCSFKVKYTEDAGCGCTCSSGCGNLQTGTVQNAQNATVCLFGTSISEINENYDQNAIIVNGTRPGYCTSESSCNTKLASAGTQKIDGGYYIEIPKTTGCRNPSRNNEDCSWIRVIASGSPTVQCTEPESSSSEEPESSSSEEVEKLDCFFALNNAGTSSLNGSATPGQQIYICVTAPSGENKQTTLTGTDKNGAINKTDFWLDYTKTVCHYFEAPTTANSYPFDVKIGNTSVCNTAPTLVVESANPTTSSSNATSSSNPTTSSSAEIAMSYSQANTKFTLSAGSTSIYIASGKTSLQACNLSCNGPSSFSMTAGGQSSSGGNYIGLTLAPSYCYDGTILTIEVNADVWDCMINMY